MNGRAEEPVTTPVLGYCTNVHGGANLAELKASLLRHAAGVKDRVSPEHPLPIGLWLSARVVRQLLGSEGEIVDFREFLRLHGLRPFTFNAFPVGDFHAREVKHRVYRPDWSEYERLEYTIAVAEIAAELADEGEEVSISTLPVGWGKGEATGCDPESAGRSLRAVAERLHRVEEDTGRLIHLDLEPEPGCYLDSAADVVGFFREYLLARGDEDIVRRHIRVCHDVCHSAVMFEPQGDALRVYSDEGIAVGKVQLSSAVRVDFDQRGDAGRAEALRQLSSFAEDRYLHQTMVRSEGGVLAFFDDLPAALEFLGRQRVAECRVHFHVPVYARGLGILGTTSGELEGCISDAIDMHRTMHFEVETYAWGVLPREFAPESVEHGIAEEIRYVRRIAPGVFGA